ncbi:hypothetical protein DVH24_026138 [Malus domestica]|uniref:Leucine-rich repeat-containing N-terminal plant-type domain-containing protein n=1 Tax=Malus domestica TaxID=3750 RepID=A0A498KMT9_MALDO|nr:hypothetical protein DVH24_026138 [Malus domestica]
MISLTRNQLDRLIPSKLWQCKDLRQFSLGFLFLFFSSIEVTKVMQTRTIPDEISDLPKLETLVLEYNKHNGVIPSKLFNNSLIREIGLCFNQLLVSGSLPANIGLKVPNLELLYVARNNLVAGVLPNLSYASKLTELDIVM